MRQNVIVRFSGWTCRMMLLIVMVCPPALAQTSLADKGYIHNRKGNELFNSNAYEQGEEYKRGALSRVVTKYFKDSYLGVVSSLIEEEEVSLEELKRLIEKVEKSKTNK